MFIAFVIIVLPESIKQFGLQNRPIKRMKNIRGEGGTPYIKMIGMIVVFFRGCNRRFGIF